MANVIEIVIKQTGQGTAIVDVNKALGGMKGAGDTAIASLLNVGKALAGVGAIATTAIVGFAASGVKAAMDVDHQLAQIAATLGTTKDTAMPLKQLMTDLALDPKLTVNVTQAGEAIEVLAANGLELQDILEGGARGAVQLANATGSDFATAATIATDAMQQFGFEANQLEQVADGIAGVLIKSKFSADDYALALSNAGGIAGNLGVDLTDFNTVLAATSSFFSSGSDAGTSFKTLLTRLAKPTDDVKSAMEEFGLSIFDSKGQMKPFAEIAGQLQDVFKGLNEEEKAELATRLGGADAMRTVLGLAQMTEEQFNALSGEVNRSGLASQAAATRVDSLTGAWEIFKGIIEAVQIQVGDKFLPVIRQVTEAVSVWASENSGQIVAFFGQIATGIELVIAKGTELFNAFQEGGVKGLAAAIGITPDQIAMVESGVKLAMDNLDAFKGALVGIGAVVGVGILASLAASLMALLTPITLLAAGAALLGAAWMGNWGNIQGIVGSAVAYITEQFNALMGLLNPAIASFQQSFAQLSASFAQTGIDSSTLTNILSAMGNFIVGVLIPAWVQWIGFLAGVAAATFSAWVTYIQTAYAAWQTFSGFIQSDVVPALLTINEGITTINAVLTAFGGLVNAVVNKALQAMAGLWQNVLLPALIKVGETLNKVLFPVFQNIGKTVSTEVSPPLQDLAETVMPLLQEGLDFVSEAIKRTIGYFNSLKASVSSFTLPDILTPGSPPPMAIAMMDIANSTNAANDAVKGMMDSLAASKWDTIRTKVFDVIDDMQDAGHYAAMGFGQTTGEHIKRAFQQAFVQSFQGIISGTITATDLENLTKHLAGAYADRVSGNFDKIVRQTRQVSLEMIREMQDELLSALPSIASNLSGLAGQFGEFLKPEMDARGKMIKRLQEFMASEGDGLFKFDWKERLVGVDHVMMGQVQAQSQLNMLLREQAAQEQLITEQKEAQQKLSFLQAQVDLIKQGKELGINFSDSIRFGLGASAGDMLAATNELIGAMLNQIDTTLQIASPSKVVFKKFRDQIGGAAVMGLEAVRPMLSSVTSAMLDPLTGGSVTNSRTTNNYFNQTVNTRAESSTVIGDFRSLQLMAGT